LVSERLEDLDRQLVDLRALRTELHALLADWDVRLAAAPHGARAHLLETLAGRPAIDKASVRRRTAKPRLQ
jgi:hypothetical protein